MKNVNIDFDYINGTDEEYATYVNNKIKNIIININNEKKRKLRLNKIKKIFDK